MVFLIHIFINKLGIFNLNIHIGFYKGPLKNCKDKNYFVKKIKWFSGNRIVFWNMDYYLFFQYFDSYDLFPEFGILLMGHPVQIQKQLYFLLPVMQILIAPVLWIGRVRKSIYVPPIHCLFIFIYFVMVSIWKLKCHPSFYCHEVSDPLSPLPRYSSFRKIYIGSIPVFHCVWCRQWYRMSPDTDTKILFAWARWT